METSAVGVKVLHQLHGCDVGVEGSGMAEVVIPDLVYRIAEELGSGLFSRLVRCEVSDEDSMFGFPSGMDDGRGVIGHSWICWWLWWNWKGVPPRRGVGCCWLYEPDEVVGSCLIVGDVEEERVQEVPDGC